MLRARVSGSYSTVNYGLRPVGAVVGGVLGSTLGLRPTLWIATVAGVTGVLWLIPSPIPRMRTLPAHDDEPIPTHADLAAVAQVEGTKSGPTIS